ncbi:hypothetical protein FHR32_002594 [Streptosporangium album]|uniref:Uncharacterized protein n=1 Tax=Streptosporangium album TaxID=47479 RepID=A0A7W7RU57_9ACTN|nr:hypothetical protein [Streptosporangium album]MBB4938289.1 hypothetical protein [Streptosporangium album]
MRKLSLDALARERLERAAAASTGRSGGTSWEGCTGDLLVIPQARHSVEALKDTAFLLSVFLLSVAKPR